jgi:inosine-uridine nucleoside N-ribohydrolase
VDVETTGSLTRGTTVADERGFWGRPVNAGIATTTDADLFFDDLIERVAAFARERRGGPRGMQ